MLKLKEFRKQKGVNQETLAAFLGVTQATLSGWENEKYEMDNKSLLKCADYFGVSIDELMGRAFSIAESSKKGIKIPVLGCVAAGIPIESIEDILDFEELDSEQFNPNYRYFGLKIKGDSMMPRIQDGDVVIVRQQPDVESGEVAIVCINGDEATCKQLKKHADGISLVSFNSTYEPMFFTNQEIIEKPISILGKVVELRGKF